MLALLLAACTDPGTTPDTKDGSDTATDTADTDTGDTADLGPATGCPAFTSYDVVGRASTYVVPGFPDGDWQATLEVTALDEDGRFTVVTREGTSRSMIETSWVRSCDDEGVWLHEYTTQLYTAGSADGGPWRLVLDHPYHELPAALNEGVTWTDRRVGVGTGDEGSAPYEGPLDEFTVAETTTVDTEAGPFEAVWVRHLEHWGGGAPDSVQYNGRHYSETVGLVAVDSGGTENGRVLLDTNAR